MFHRKSISLLILAAVVLLSQCSQRSPQHVIRIGYFPNITHSQALVGLSRGDFKSSLGPDIAIEAKAFNAGPSVIEALFAGQIDVAYIGPNPAINGYVRSKGEALRVVAGASSGGAALVVRSNAAIQSPADLANKTIATPQLGNTQDVALRGYLASLGLSPKEKGGSVTVTPMENPTILDAFRQARIDGAWVPEPWASRLEIEGKGRVLVDERTLWSNGEFATALVIASKKMLTEHRDWLKKVLRAHVRITQWELASADEPLRVANAEIKRQTGKDLPLETLKRAWQRMKPTYDPLASTLQKSADSAFVAGFLKSRPDLGGLVDLGPLNEVLADEHLPLIQEGSL
ncbi:MAG TPA: ABC transporter substrate-binding protein [Spirochaetia bacterium]|nr:ABC transporter substrate-binding protein [Spirochaetia bacterium]